MIDITSDEIVEKVARKLCENDLQDPDETYEIFYRDPWPDGETVTRCYWEDYETKAYHALIALKEVIDES